MKIVNMLKEVHKMNTDNQGDTTFTMISGNTTIYIKSSLPNMTPIEREIWYKENDHTPEIQRIKKAWIEALIYISRTNENSSPSKQTKSTG